jgi:hypothetical protein
MATIEERIEAALIDRVRALILSPALPLAWPNNVAEPPPPYLRIDFFRNRNERIAIKGSLPHRRLGILQITVVTPLNAGPSNATSIAGRVAEHFPADLVLDYDGVSVRIEAAPDVLSGSKEDASYDVITSIRYECFA